MGICHSSEPASTAADTAKLILQDGRLQEFAHPVRVSRVLQSCDPACFICDSDDMGFDGVVSAVDGDEELRPGQLYFALPLSRLRRPLEAKEMAALAVKASLAMKGKGRGQKCGRARAAAAAFSGGKEGRRPAEVGGRGGGGDGGSGSAKRRGGGGCGRRRRKSVAILSAIPE
ncbi:translation initiation factor IF-2 [Eucalyptus grandis]|uniref:translation initiation factor IF-2 n=1 Tax=Eucalyptus grandis TaxID=71139 RepID=UPI00192E7890|nr:translation initiation factor IF-2 [Eucalyptus grandis]